MFTIENDSLGILLYLLCCIGYGDAIYLCTVNDLYALPTMVVASLLYVVACHVITNDIIEVTIYEEP